MKRVIVIGGGASGLMAAIMAAREGASVTMLEAMEKPGKKLLITGNGKCNLTNTAFLREDCYRHDGSENIKSVLDACTMEMTLEFFHQIGILTHVRNGGVYPVTDQASSVVELLIAEARSLKVKIKCNEKVESLTREGTVWKTRTATWQYEGESVILACGGKSYPLTGSDGSGYELARKLGIQVITPLPALVPLVIEENIPARLSGIRSQADVTLTVSEYGQEQSWKESGEVQWTDYGVSGIVIFQLSRYAVKACEKKQKAILTIDVLPEYTKKELMEFFQEMDVNRSLGEILKGMLPKKMIPVALKSCNLKAEAKLESIKTSELESLIGWVKQIRLNVKGCKSFDMAQVCQGGIALHEVDLTTLEAKKHSGLYITGELLDVDGICGGYNLQWAFSSGYVAGKASAKT